MPKLPLARLLLAALCALMLGGCASAPLYQPVPEPLALSAQPVGFDDRVRFWGDAVPEDLERLLQDKLNQSSLRFARRVAENPQLITLDFLAISGGGSDGAFGAGFMKGWTEHGTRPEFEIVTGISTGALIAPFAFLGPDWDEALEVAYTSITPDRIFAVQLFSGIFGDALGILDSGPLRRTIADFLTPQMFAAIAEEHLRGRRLVIQTTNLDAQRPVLWDLGALAVIGTPQALDLARDILLASASIPGAFPPVKIPVTVGGRRYEELHVDGGVTSQVSFLPAQLRLYEGPDVPIQVNYRLFVIRNGKLVPEYSEQDGLVSIVSRSVSTLIKNHSIGDISRLYMFSARNSLEFFLAAIPEDFDAPIEGEFDPAYMKALFDVGQRRAAAGYAWRRQPPGFELAPEVGPSQTVLAPPTPAPEDAGAPVQEIPATAQEDAADRIVDSNAGG